MKTQEYFQPGIGYLTLCPKCAVLRGYGKGFLTLIGESSAPCEKCATAAPKVRPHSMPMWECWIEETEADRDARLWAAQEPLNRF